LSNGQDARFPFAKFADVAFKLKIRLENWSDNLSAPGKGLQSLHQAHARDLFELTAPALHQLRREKNQLKGLDDTSSEQEDDSSAGKHLRMVRWSEGKQ
jgi:hypothetical protein